MEKIQIKGLEIFAYHGVNPEEKTDGQKFILDITLYADLSAAMASDRLEDTINYAAVRKTVQRVMTGAKYDLIEHTASQVADAVLAGFPAVLRVTVLLKKPNAPMNATFDYVAVEVERERDGRAAASPEEKAPDFSAEEPARLEAEAIQTGKEPVQPEDEKAETSAPVKKGLLNFIKGKDAAYKQAYIALGSNIGDRGENLNRAVWALASVPGVRISAASRVYETEPVGYRKQEKFYNAVVRVETTLTPRALLGVCLGVESGMGRIRGKKNGPRVIDLDLLLYEGEKCQSRELTLPHPRMEERAFVLSPLCDLVQDPYYLHILKELGRGGVKVTGASIIKP